MKNETFENAVQLFSQRHKGHNLEILNITQEGTSSKNSIYQIFNHRTGTTTKYREQNNNLPGLIKQILDDTILFDESSKRARLYQKLTGQKKLL